MVIGFIIGVLATLVFEFIAVLMWAFSENNKK